MLAKDSNMRKCYSKLVTYLQEKRQASSPAVARALVLFKCLILSDDVMFIEKSKRYSMAFENQFHYGVFYAYLKLREMEIKNIVWLAELVSIGVPRQMPGWSKYVVPFKYHKELVEKN